MKEATGELSMTLVTIIAIGVIVAIFTAFWPQIENAINAIFEDIADIKNGDKKLTFELIINYTKLLDGNIPEGYDSVDDFRKAQKRLNDKNTTAAESITERIKRANGKDISTMSPDEAKNEIYKYLKAYFDDKIKAGGNIEN